MKERVAQLLYELYGRHEHKLSWGSLAAAIQELYLNRAEMVLTLFAMRVEELENPNPRTDIDSTLNAMARSWDDCKATVLALLEEA